MHTNKLPKRLHCPNEIYNEGYKQLPNYKNKKVHVMGHSSNFKKTRPEPFPKA